MAIRTHSMTTPKRSALLFLAITISALLPVNGKTNAHRIRAVICSVVTSSGEPKGKIRIAVNPDWAPLGASRFLALVDDNFFENHPLYRAVPDFLVQFGVAADPEVQKHWDSKPNLPDDPDRGLAFKYGMLSFAGSGPNSRGTSMFLATSRRINQLNHFGTQLWETPFGFVTEGIDVLEAIYTGYGDMQEQGGQGPSQRALVQRGSAALVDFPDLDYFSNCARDKATEEDKMIVNTANWPRINRAPAEPPSHSDGKVQIKLLNKTEKKMDLYWMPNDGAEGEFQATIKPGGHVDQSSFVGHVFAWKLHGSDRVLHKTHIKQKRKEYVFDKIVDEL